MVPTKKIIFIILNIILLGIFTPQNTQASFIGGLPNKISLIIKRIINPTTRNIFKNCLLIWGPPGNGKTTLAGIVARETGSTFLRMQAPTIVGKYVGEGAQRIKDLFAQARILTEQNKHVVIFIDEIDAIAAHSGTEMRTEHLAALQQLWLELDECKDNQNIFVIFATNRLDQINKAFLDRFGSNTIECPNPDETLRKKVLNHYFKKYNISLEEPLLCALAQKTEGLSVRALEDLACEVAVAADTKTQGQISQELIYQELAHIKNKFASKNKHEPFSWQQFANITTTVHSLLGIALCIYTIYNITLGKNTNAGGYLLRL